MGIGWIFNSEEPTNEYDRGYAAANEFLDLTSDHTLTQEEANAQWEAVEVNHSQEYLYGYARSIYDTAQPWWKFW